MTRNVVVVWSVFFFLMCIGNPVSLSVYPGEISSGDISIEYRNVTVYAPAVAQTTAGYQGVISTITVTIQSNGSGRVFVDTLPLTQIDMQGSARLAVKVASSLVRMDPNITIDPAIYDYFFVVRTEAPIIGGPSAGGIMTVAVTALLGEWPISNTTVMTGMINPDGSIGPVGGITSKIDAAYTVGATRFLIPKGQGTYTETITETTSENGWTQIITRQVLRNVSEYAMTNYGIEVVEVEDIDDALLYFTGWQPPEVLSDDPITTEEYITSMKPLATTLLTRAQSHFENASDHFDQADIPNRYPFYYRNQVTDFLNDAEDTLAESETWFDQDQYYTSTSKSFQSLINSQFVLYAVSLFDQDDQQHYVSDLLLQAQQMNTNNSHQAETAPINGSISLQCVGAAQQRASEADKYLSDAQSDLSNGDFFTALYQIAYAVQRSDSVGWWINISSAFNDTGDITEDDLLTLATEYIEDAQQAIIYSNVILQEVGQSSTYITQAETLLSSARDNKDKDYLAAALFGALEALVRANLALELVDGSDEDKLLRAEELAATSIAESRNRGIEPVLAVSYYEFAQSLKNESSFDAALEYYKYSDLIAGVVALTDATITSNRGSRYIGIPDIHFSFWERMVFSNLEVIFFFTSIGAVGGFGLALIIVGLSGKRPKKPKTTTAHRISDIPRNINEYYQK